MIRFFFGSLTLGLLAAAANAEDAVAFKSFTPQTGQRIKVSNDEKNTTTSSFTIKGTKKDMEEVKTKTIVYIDEVLDNAAKTRPAAKIKRTYEKSVLTKDGKNIPFPLDGKTITIEKKGDKYVFTAAGEAVTGEGLKLLDNEFNRPTKSDSQDFYFPKKPVKTGDSWDVDALDIIKLVSDSGLNLDAEKATAKGTLKKTFTKGQSQYGSVDFVFEAPVTGIGPKSAVTIQSGKMTIKSSGESCIDGSLPASNMTTKIKLAISGTVQGIDLQIESNATENRTIELLTK